MNDKELDCCFTEGNNWFRYRAAAIIIEDGCVLLVGNKAETYLYSVGGGVHHGETAESAVLREVYEETGIHYEIDRLAVIHENFFNENSGSLKGLRCHEISFYYLMKPRGTKQTLSDSYTRFGDKEQLFWVPIEELPHRRAYPSFLYDYLKGDTTGIAHIVTDDRKRGA